MDRSGAAASPDGAAVLALCVGASALLLFGGTACPTIYFGDSAELISAAADLGIAHPPGYPLYTLIGKLALSIPVGEPAWRMNVVSALFAAVTCAAVCLLVRRWTGSAAAAVGAPLALATSSTFWASSTVAEVYTLHLMLVTALFVAATPGVTRYLSTVGARAILAGGALGLGLSHRPTILLALPAVLILVGPTTLRRRGNELLRSRGAWIGLALAFGLPVLFYLGMMLRSRTAPATNWGTPDTLHALWAHVTGQRYGSYVVGPRGWFDPGRLSLLGRELGRGFGYLAPVLGLVGILLSWRRGLERRSSVALVTFALLAWMFASSYSTPDAEVLLLPLLLAVSLASGAGIAALERLGGGAGRSLVWLLVAAVVSVPLSLNLQRRDLRRVTAAEDYMQDMARTVTADGVLFVEGDDAFLLAYLTRVLGQRNDITIYDRSGQLFPDELNEPGPPRRAGEGGLTYRIRREREYALRNVSRRDVYFSGWPGYPPPATLRFEPVGLFQQLRIAKLPPRAVSDLWSSYRGHRVGEQAARIGTVFGISVAARYPLMRGERALFDGDRSLAIAELERAAIMGRRSEATQISVGAIYGRLGEYDLAIRAFEAAIATQPVSVRAWNNLALARSLSGDVAGARRAWERSLRILPDQPEVRQQLAGLAR